MGFKGALIFISCDAAFAPLDLLPNRFFEEKTPISRLVLFFVKPTRRYLCAIFMAQIDFLRLWATVSAKIAQILCTGHKICMF